MNVLIVGRKDAGTCDLSGKKNVEVWQIKVSSGEVKNVANNKLIECLRLLTAVSSPAQAKNGGESQ